MGNGNFLGADMRKANLLGANMRGSHVYDPNDKNVQEFLKESREKGVGYKVDKELVEDTIRIYRIILAQSKYETNIERLRGTIESLINDKIDSLDRKK